MSWSHLTSWTGKTANTQKDQYTTATHLNRLAAHSASTEPAALMGSIRHMPITVMVLIGCLWRVGQLVALTSTGTLTTLLRVVVGMTGFPVG